MADTEAPAIYETMPNQQGRTWRPHEETRHHSYGEPNMDPQSNPDPNSIEHHRVAEHRHAHDYLTGSRPLQYGSFVKQSRSTREPLVFMTLVGAVVGPTFIFILLSYINSMEIRHMSKMSAPNHPYLRMDFAMAISWFLLIFIFVGGCVPAMDVHSVRGRLWQFLLFSGLLAWVCGVVLGNENYGDHFEPYYDINNLNFYPSVDPSSSIDGSTHAGAQFMDAGQFEFIPGSKLNISQSYGFKNKDVYCVAPIVLGAKAKPAAQFNSTAIEAAPPPTWNQAVNPLETYDFWAVGTNCCSGHAPDFHCGEFNNPSARKGLRLMKDDDRGYFRLAVKEAESAYNIKATHPVFVYWMSDPQTEIDSYISDGHKSFLMSILMFAVLQVCLTYCAATFYI